MPKRKNYLDHNYFLGRVEAIATKAQTTPFLQVKQVRQLVNRYASGSLAHQWKRDADADDDKRKLIAALTSKARQQHRLSKNQFIHAAAADMLEAQNNRIEARRTPQSRS